jgi:hypothetical protein
MREEEQAEAKAAAALVVLLSEEEKEREEAVRAAAAELARTGSPAQWIVFGEDIVFVTPSQDSARREVRPALSHYLTLLLI